MNNAQRITAENAQRLQAAATHGHAYASLVAACGHGYEVKLTGNGEQRASEFARRKSEPCPDCALELDAWLDGRLAGSCQSSGVPCPRPADQNCPDCGVALCVACYPILSYHRPPCRTCWNGDGRPIHGYALGKPMCLPCWETAKQESVRL